MPEFPKSLSIVRIAGANQDGTKMEAVEREKWRLVWKRVIGIGLARESAGVGSVLAPSALAVQKPATGPGKPYSYDLASYESARLMIPTTSHWLDEASLILTDQPPIQTTEMTSRD
ncbi:MAG: hypothetical protein WA110_07665 [Anaerolineaceae bacterium]